MRYEKGRGDVTRRRIVEVASRKFREHGVAAVGLTAIMSESGLTNGGFYAHFASKEHLVRETIVHALRGQVATLDAMTQGGVDIEAALRGYLNYRHRDEPGGGCVTSALVAEIARRPLSTRAAYTEPLVDVVGRIAAMLPGPDRDAAQADATAVFAMMVGAMQLARAVADPALSAAIIENAVQASLALARRRR